MKVCSGLVCMCSGLVLGVGSVVIGNILLRWFGLGNWYVECCVD